MLWLVPLLPVAGAFLVIGVGRHRHLSGIVAIGIAIATLAAITSALLLDAQPVALDWRPGMGLTLAPDGFAVAMAVLVPATAAPILAYAAAAEPGRDRVRLMSWLLAFVGAQELLVLAADFLTLLIGWELVSMCSWALIGHRWREPDAPQAAREAFLTTRSGDLGLYLAAAAAFAVTGSLEYGALASAPGVGLHVVAAGVLVAAAAKSAQLPFAPWLFAAMAGPVPASALLHSATMVAAGAYALIRLGPYLAPTAWFEPVTMSLGLATAVAGGIVAALQSDIKKALAGSTSSQYGLMWVAVGAGVTAAAGAQLVAHAAFKSLLFLGAGIAIHATGTEALNRLRLGSALPAAASIFAVGVLALAAVPPLGGAYTKEAIVAGAAHVSDPLGIAVLASGVLTALYAFRLQLLAFGPGARRPLRRPGAAELAGMGVLALFSLLLGLLWLPGAEQVVEGLAGGALAASTAWERIGGLGAVLGAAGLSFALWRSNRLFTLGLPPRVRAFGAGWLGLPRVIRNAVVLPVTRLSRHLAHFDDRVVDAGVRAAAAVGRLLSRVVSVWGERGFDGLIEGLARGGLGMAGGSKVMDDRGIDGAVEATARFAGAAGRETRRLQTGLSHHYFVIAGLGLLAMGLLALLWR